MFIFFINKSMLLIGTMIHCRDSKEMSDLEEIENEMDKKTLENTLKLVYEYTGITIHENKKIMIQTRLRKRMRELNITHYSEYINYLQNNTNEVQTFINLMTTNETFFFRTEKVWNYFCKDFLVQWVLSNPNKLLSIWSGASSTGEEAYTMAICCEEFKEKNVTFKYKIVGTDISTKALSSATNGVYKNRSIEALKKTRPLLLTKYFTIEDDSYKVSESLKNNISFINHNLFDPMPINERFDIVFLRNVLIYFAAKEQEKVLSVIEKSIVENGILVLGESESIRNLKVNFAYKFPLIYAKVLSMT